MASAVHRLRLVVPVGAIVGLFLVAAIPLVLMRYSAGRAAEDQKLWHLPTIKQFAQDWPRVDLHDYGSATTPGYHLAIAAVSRLVGSSDERFLRGVNLLVTVTFLGVLASVAAYRGWLAAIVLCLPAVTSLYIFSSGAWILPDNAGWLGVLLAMMLALRRRVDVWTYLGSGCLVFLLVLVRQIDLWTIAPIVVAAFLGSEKPQTPGIIQRSQPSFVRASLAALTALPAILILCYFVHLWHGLVPPTFSSERTHDIASAGEHTGGNPAAVALALATFALFTPFYLPWIRSEPRGASATRAVVVGSIVGGVAGIIPATSYNRAAGRWSGLWNLSMQAPMIGNRSVVIAVLSIIGGGLLGYLFSRLPKRDRWIFLTAWLAFGAAQMANRQAWQRYVDPFVLITLILAASRAGDDQERKFTVAGSLPVILAMLLGAVTVVSLR